MDRTVGGFARQPRGRPLHPPLFPVFGERRPVGGQVRQGAPDRSREAAGSRHHGAGVDRLRAAPTALAAGCAVPARPAFDAVRADQVRDPAPASAAGGVDRRQRLDRGRHLRRHPARYLGRGATRGLAGGDPLDSRRQSRPGDPRLSRQPRHSCRSGSGTRPAPQPQFPGRNRRQSWLCPAGTRGVRRVAGDFLVLALRRRAAGAIPGVWPRCARGGTRPP